MHQVQILGPVPQNEERPIKLQNDYVITSVPGMKVWPARLYKDHIASDMGPISTHITERAWAGPPCTSIRFTVLVHVLDADMMPVTVASINLYIFFFFFFLLIYHHDLARADTTHAGCTERLKIMSVTYDISPE